MEIQGRMLACTIFIVLLMQNAMALENKIKFAIPTQPLSTALLEFATISGVKILFKADITRNIMSKELSGHYSIVEALDKLLENSKINYRFTQTKSITLEIDRPLKSVPILDLPDDSLLLFKPSHYKKLGNSLIPIKLDNFTVNNEPLARYSPKNSYSATKTDSPLLELPYSVQVIPSTLITDQQSVTISDSLYNVSGVIPRNPNISPNFEPTLIRGFASMQMIDGFYQNLNTGDQGSLINTQKIEVLKGPNATLYSGGSGSPAGGVINIISKLPEKQAFYEAGIKSGNYQFIQPFIDINQPINDKLLLRFTGEYTHSGSHIDILKTERYNLNPSVSYIHNDNTSLTIQAKYSTWKSQDYQGLPAMGTVAGDFNIMPELYIGPHDIPKSQSEFAGIWTTLNHQLNDIWSITAKARYAHSEHDTFVQGILGEGFDFNANKPLSVSDFKTLGIPLVPHTWALSNNELSQISNEMTFQGYATAKFSLGKTSNTFLVSGDYSQLDEKSFIDFDLLPIGFIDLTAPVFLPYQYPGRRKNNQFTNNTTFGATLQLQSTLYNRLHLLSGLRIAHVSMNYNNTTPGFELNFSTNATRALPNIGAVIELSDSLVFFANYSEGMRGQNGVNFVSTPKPELSNQVEFGIKFDLAEQVTGQFSLYQIKRENIAVTDFSDSQLRATSKGQQRSRGFEANISWQATESLNMLATYTFTDARFTDSLNVPEGNFLAGVPSHSGRFWLNYAFQFPMMRGLSIGSGIYTQSSSYLSNNNEFKTNAYYTLDSSLAYHRDIYKIGMSIKNLTNANYYQRLNYFGTRTTPARGTEFIVTGSIQL